MGDLRSGRPPGGLSFHVYRAKVPGGWLIYVYLSPDWAEVRPFTKIQITNGMESVCLDAAVAEGTSHAQKCRHDNDRGRFRRRM